MTHAQAKGQGQRSLGQTDEQTEAIALPPELTRLINIQPRPPVLKISAS